MLEKESASFYQYLCQHSQNLKRVKLLLDKSFLSSSLNRVSIWGAQKLVQAVGLGKYLWCSFVAKRRAVPPARTLPAKLLRHSNKLAICLCAQLWPCHASICGYQCLQNQNLKISVENYIMSVWNVLDADIGNRAFEGVCYISLNLVNFMFQLINFVHEKFEELHLTHFWVIQEEKKNLTNFL